MGCTTQGAMLTAALALGTVSDADAQTIQGGWELRVSNVVSPAQPTTTVEIWAWWDPTPSNLQIFGGSGLDLVAASGEFTLGTHVLGAGTVWDPGHRIVGSRINRIPAGQLHIPPLGFFGNPDNPVHIFDGTWTTTDFSHARDVNVWTENTYSFILSDWATGATTQLYPQGFSPGSGVIEVVPAPAAGAVVVGLGFYAARRKRPHVRSTG